MSLILEALRKSEAERRRGQAPQLFDPPATAVPAAPKRPAHALWWAMPVVLSAVLLMMWRYAATSQPAGEAASFDQANPDDGAARTAQVEAPVTQRLPATIESTGAVARAEPAATAPSLAPATNAAPDAMPVASANPEAVPVEPASAEPASVERARIDRAAAATAGATRPEPVAAPAPLPAARPAAARTTQPAAIASTRPLPPPPEQVGPASTTSPVTPPAATVGPYAASGSNAEPLRLADLAPVDRRSLPPLKMSMHMWSADSAQRFVILDGARVGEGDRVGEAVIEEITRDGAVLAWAGRRVKVPVR